MFTISGDWHNIQCIILELYTQFVTGCHCVCNGGGGKKSGL